MTKTIKVCDFCGSEKEVHYKVKLPTTKSTFEDSRKLYLDKYENFINVSFSNEKELDMCKECVNKVFEAFGVKECGSLIK